MRCQDDWKARLPSDDVTKAGYVVGFQIFGLSWLAWTWFVLLSMLAQSSMTAGCLYQVLPYVPKHNLQQACCDILVLQPC